MQAVPLEAVGIHPALFVESFCLESDHSRGLRDYLVAVEELVHRHVDWVRIPQPETSNVKRKIPLVTEMAADRGLHAEDRAHHSHRHFLEHCHPERSKNYKTVCYKFLYVGLGNKFKFC